MCVVCQRKLMMAHWLRLSGSTVPSSVEFFSLFAWLAFMVCVTVWLLVFTMLYVLLLPVILLFVTCSSVNTSQSSV